MNVLDMGTVLFSYIISNAICIGEKGMELKKVLEQADRIMVQEKSRKK